MRPLNPDLRAVARLLATGQVLLSTAAAPGDTQPIVIMADPTPDLAKMAEQCFCTALSTSWPGLPAETFQPKEPWRRGRPLR